VSIAGRLFQRGDPTVRGPDGAALDQRASIDVVPAEAKPDDPLAGLRREALQEAPVVGLSELRAAAVMVAEGQATQVILAGFPTWPGLLTEIECLSRELDLSILPTIVRGGGRVDLVVSPAGGDDH
jgi:hypothetical protein